MSKMLTIVMILKALRYYSNIDRECSPWKNYGSNHNFFTKISLSQYITEVHKLYKPKTIKRKIASLKAFYHYLQYEEILDANPFDKIDIKFREPQRLPKTIPFQTIQTFIRTIYNQRDISSTNFQQKIVLRDIAVIELLFATGVRISELCSLRPLINYKEVFQNGILSSGYFFVNRLNKRLSEQSVRYMINAT